MTRPIEDYAIIGDTQTVALVSSEGSIDWLCLPRFDSAACFAALLGDPDHGRWLLRPREKIVASRRRYRKDSLVLETELETASGTVRIVDAMPVRRGDPDLVRVVEGVSGEVPMRMELIVRFDYGSIVPWVESEGGHLRAVAGPEALHLFSPVATEGMGMTTQAEFTVREGDQVPFLLLWHPSHEDPSDPVDPVAELEHTDAWWREWSDTCAAAGPHRDAVVRSLITLKALTYAPTGGIVAAATTSLPEHIGGVRNWDYRFCWLRDATFTLYALGAACLTSEAAAWRDWLLRAVAGDPSKLQIMYGVAGERRLTEQTLDWLPGYESSRPVRAGNGAATQLQIDVYGEVLDAMHAARRAGLEPDQRAWSLQRQLLEHLERAWKEPDEGIWEVRGPRRHFTHSKVMAWVAFDRAVKAVRAGGLEGPVEQWEATRDEIHREVCQRGFDPERDTFTQCYGSPHLDAALLLLPLVGFLPASDPRIRGTVRAIEQELMVDGLVMRYAHEDGGAEVDGLPAGEGAFLACSFWLVDNYVLQGRLDEAHTLFERLLALRNDVGLLSEEVDPRTGRFLGNFPQAFSHVGLVNSALALTHKTEAPGCHRHEESPLEA